MASGNYWNGSAVVSNSPPDSVWSTSDSTPANPNDFDPADKKERHKLVERNRRDKTRSYVQQLQCLVPNVSDRSSNPNINVILENTLEFLQTVKIESSESEGSEEEADTASASSSPKEIENAKSRITAVSGSPLDDLLGRKHMFTFYNAPFGMVIARADGSVLLANPCFENFFKFPRGSLTGRTMFSLTAPLDLPHVMQVFRLSTTRVFQSL